MSIMRLAREAQAQELSEVEKLGIVEKLTAQDDKYNFLQEAVESEQKTKAKDSPEGSAGFGEPSASSSSSSDSSSSDDNSDAGGEDDEFGGFDDLDDDASGDEEDSGAESSDESEASEPEDSEAESVEATESIRDYPNLVYAQEGPIWDATVVTGATVGGLLIAGGKKTVELGGKAIGFTFNATKALAVLGVTYGPTIYKHISKTVLYVFVRSMRSYLGLRKKLIKHLRLSSKRIKKQQETLAAVALGVKTLETEPRESKERHVVDEKLLGWLSLDGVFDPVASAERILALTQGASQTLVDQAAYEVDHLEKLLDMAGQDSLAQTQRFVTLLTPKALGRDFVRVTDKSYAYDTRLLSLYGYKASLPDNRRIIMTVPRTDLTKSEQLSMASQRSVAFLGIEPTYARLQSEVDYMDTPELARFVTLLQEISQSLWDNQERLKAAGKRTDKLKLGYKHYFDRLYSSSDKVSYEDSLADLVNAKQAFINRVYLPCAMDLHSYTLSYVAHATRYVRLCIK